MNFLLRRTFPVAVKATKNFNEIRANGDAVALDYKKKKNQGKSSSSLFLGLR